MTTIIDIAKQVFRKYSTFGVPASGASEPDKDQIVGLFGAIQAQIAGGTGGLPDDLATDIATVAGGIENLAATLTDAQTAAANAALSEDVAAAVAGTLGVVKFFDTKALATAGLGGLSNGQSVMVFADETHSGDRTMYLVSGGALVFKANVSGLSRNLTNLSASTLQKTGFREAIGAAELLTGEFRGEDDRVMHIVAGVVSRQGSGWDFLVSHPTKNVATVTTDETGSDPDTASLVRIDFDSTGWGASGGALKAVCFIATPDEDYSSAGISVGTGGFDSWGGITFYKDGLSTYITSNGTTFSKSGGGLTSWVTSMTWNASTHRVDVVLGNPATVASARVAPFVVTGETDIDAKVAAVSTTSGITTVSIAFFDATGAKLTAQSASMAFWLHCQGRTRLNPLTELPADFGNVWFLFITAEPAP